MLLGLRIISFVFFLFFFCNMLYLSSAKWRKIVYLCLLGHKVMTVLSKLTPLAPHQDGTGCVLGLFVSLSVMQKVVPEHSRALDIHDYAIKTWGEKSIYTSRHAPNTSWGTLLPAQPDDVRHVETLFLKFEYFLCPTSSAKPLKSSVWLCT